MSSQNEQVPWPAYADRTPPEQRESGTQFSVGWQRTKGELRKELSRLGASEHSIYHVTGSSSNPAVMVTWFDGADRSIVCDAYDTKAANLRSIYLWVRETRKAGERPVQTPGEQFAAVAALPAPDDPIVADEPPHQILGVQPDAPSRVVKAAARSLLAESKPTDGSDPDKEKFLRVQRAKEAMLDE